MNFYRFIAVITFLLLTVTVAAAEVSRMIPIRDVAIPLSEELLNGDVVRMVYSAETEVAQAGSMVWEKVDLDDSAMPGMTFLMPQAAIERNPKPFLRSVGASKEKYTYFWVPMKMDEIESIPGIPEIYLHMHRTYILSKYDSHGRIREMRPFVLWNALTGISPSFRYKFEYGDENDCRRFRSIFRHADLKTESEIGLTKLQYEDGRVTQLISKGNTLFFNPGKIELTYDEHGFLASMTAFEDDRQQPWYTKFYRNHEHDRHGNWTRRDVFLGEQRRGTEKREIYYTGDALPAAKP